MSKTEEREFLKEVKPRWQKAAQLLRQIDEKDDFYLSPQFCRQAGRLAELLELNGQPYSLGLILLDGGVE